MKKFILALLFLCMLSPSVFAFKFWSPLQRHSNQSSPYRDYISNSANSYRVTVNARKINTLNGRLFRNTVSLQAQVAQNKELILLNEGNIAQQADRLATLESSSGTSTDVTTSLYAAGVLIGTIRQEIYLPFTGAFSTYLKFSPDFHEIELKTGGNFGNINISATGNPYYENLDCTGRMYMDMQDHSEDAIPFIGKQLGGVLIMNNNTLFYYPPNWKPQTGIVIQSGISGSFGVETCVSYNVDTTAYDYREIFFNDPSITGIQEYPLPLPLTFQ